MSAKTAKGISNIFLGAAFASILITLIQLIVNWYDVYIGSSYYSLFVRLISSYIVYIPFLLLIGIVALLALTIAVPDKNLERTAFILFLVLLIHKAVVMYVGSNLLTYAEVTSLGGSIDDLARLIAFRTRYTTIIGLGSARMTIGSYVFSITSLELFPIISIAMGRAWYKTQKNGYLYTTGMSLLVGLVFLFIYHGIFGYGYSSIQGFISPFILEFALIAYAFYYTYVKDVKLEEEIKTRSEVYYE